MPAGIATPLCRQLGIEVPIVQAPIGSATTPELVAAVAEAGALGMLALTWVPESELVGRLSRARQLTSRPFALNFVLAFPVEEKLARCLDEGVRIISTAWGDPAALAVRIHAAGGLQMHVVGSVDEAKRAVDAGVDVIVAQGWEAGGHVRGVVASMPLIPAVVDAVAPRPVIAAGGIADGRGLAACLVLGAQAAWLGTRFLTASEALTHEMYRRRVMAARAEDAMYTDCFDGGWPGTPHRALRNSTMSRWEEAGRPRSPERPGEGDIVAVDLAEREHRRYDDIMPLSGMRGQLDELALYAGQSAGLVRNVAPAGQIVRHIVAEAEDALRRAATVR
ncbi:MAG: nitronate monooxygenase [Chloroflexota bacterium]|nr:nitronate monooxygenase [Chloroflexota bacterium]